MSEWIFEPGHTAAEFSVRHMMVTNVRGHFKDIHGTLQFDPANPAQARVEVRIDVSKLWTGEPDRDAHLKSPDFLDAQNHRQINFRSTGVRQLGPSHFRVTGDLTIRDTTKSVLLEVQYLGQWETPFWVGNRNLGPVTRSGFVATTRINRHDYQVSWNSVLDHGGLVVGDDVHITIDAEAMRSKEGLPLPA